MAQDRDLDINKQAEIDLQSSLRRQNIEDIVTSISRDPNQLFKFVYELRKADSKEKFSFEFMNGNIQSPVLVDLFLSNKWDSSKDIMTPTSRNKYCLLVGTRRHFLVGPHKNKDEEVAQVYRYDKITAQMTCEIQLILVPNGVLICSFKDGLGKYLDLQSYT